MPVKEDQICVSCGESYNVVLLAFFFFQRALEWFAAECEAGGMKVSSSKSKAMVLNQKKVQCSLRVRDQSLPEAEEFKYLGILLMSDGKLEREMNRLELHQHV